jgi:ABC-2 type transport system permease protein
MNRAWAITKKELHQYFKSPAIYIAFAIYFFIVSLMFILISFDPSSMQIEGTMSFIIETRNISYAMNFILPLLLLPFLSIRLISEEVKQGTDELLLTSPANLFEIVIGKYLSVLIVIVMLTAVSLIYPAVMLFYGNLEWSVLASNYLVFFLLAATMMAVGLFASALFESQIVAGIAALLILFVLWLTDSIAGTLFSEQRDLIGEFSLMGRIEDLQRGLLDWADVLFYVMLITVFLVITIKVFERKRWN